MIRIDVQPHKMIRGAGASHSGALIIATNILSVHLKSCVAPVVDAPLANSKADVLAMLAGKRGNRVLHS